MLLMNTAIDTQLSTSVSDKYRKSTLVHLKVRLWGEDVTPSTVRSTEKVSPRLQKRVVDSQELASKASTGRIMGEIRTRLGKFSFSGQQCQGKHSLDSPHLQGPAVNARSLLCP